MKKPNLIPLLDRKDQLKQDLEAILLDEVSVKFVSKNQQKVQLILALVK